MEHIYLDHAATTPLDPAVFEVMKPYLLDEYGNASSVHQMGRRARVAMEEARTRVADCLGAESSEIVFTSGGTEADNLALKGVLGAVPTGENPEARLVTSTAEHKAVVEPARRMSEQGRPVTLLSPDAQGAVTPDQVEDAIDDDTLLVSLMHTNNEIGVRTDISGVAAVCDEHDVRLHCDAVQAAGLQPLDVDDLGVDLLSLSGHKFYGPKGSGVLYVRNGVDLGPLVEGGSQERDRRGGTQNVAGAIGLAEALERAAAEADERAAQLSRLQRRLVEGLDDTVPGPYVLNTPLDEAPVAPHVVNVAFPPDGDEPLDGEMLILNLDMQGVLVSAGSACTSGALEPSHVLTALGLDRPTASAAVRFSLGAETTEKDIDNALDALRATLQRMR
ncbi:cysteine desulfurase family protein [Salinibacter altiplanensis]|uniref:cysteine desulfurase family protein n=1 Tax=Salinibacter altiplanensis TaxID=1803181 RepID=UPI000C9F634B|nr:cysteine desulfurase family protein [Salinibacter altiplanensis]